MTTPNRAAILNKTLRVLKKHYKPAAPSADMPVLEALLLASCLENAHLHTAEKVFAAIKTSFFDWNEVRVSTVKELAEVMEPLPEPGEAAGRLKGILQSVFESEYSFDLESLKKQNIGQATKRLNKLDGMTQFVASYAVQMALGGHSIPVDRGLLGAMVVLGVINDSDAEAGVVPGIERAIPKSKGREFGRLLHELGADFATNPHSPALRDLLVSIVPDARQRMPKRGAKKPPAEPPAPPPKESAGKKKPAGKVPVERKKEPAGARKSLARDRKAAAAQPKKKIALAKKKSIKPLARRKPR